MRGTAVTALHDGCLIGGLKLFILYFAVCGPKYIRLCHSASEVLQFTPLFV